MKFYFTFSLADIVIRKQGKMPENFEKIRYEYNIQSYYVTHFAYIPSGVAVRKKTIRKTILE